MDSYLDRPYKKWGTHFEFDILAPATVRVESVNKAYHFVGGSFKITDDTKKAIFLTDIGQNSGLSRPKRVKVV